MFLIFVFSLVLCAAFASRAVTLGWITVAPQERRLGSLDGARGILAMLVALHHYLIWINVGRGDPWQAPEVFWHNTAGQTGVALFFMISGALFYSIILKAGTDVNWRSIYISRLFRIYPLVFVAVGLMMLLVLSRGGAWHSGDGLGLMLWLSTLGAPRFMGQEDLGTILGVTWTLKYEWAFYLLLPVLALLLRLFRSGQSRLLMLGVATILLLVVHRFGPSLPLDPFFFAFFSVGMICLELSRIPRIRDRLTGPGAAFVALATLAAQMTLQPGTFNMGALLLLAIVFLPIVAGNPFGGVLRTRGLLALGEISYSIYLMHGLLLSVVMIEGGLLPAITGSPTMQLVALPAVMLGITAMSVLGFTVVERPAIRLGRQVADWRAATLARRQPS